MGASLDGRDHGNPYVRNVLQSLEAFIVNPAPDARIGDISERRPLYVSNEIPTCACHDDNLVRSILPDPVKGINKLRVRLRAHDERAGVAMELGNEHTFGITRQFQIVIRGKVVSLKCLHGVLLSWLSHLVNIS